MIDEFIKLPVEVDQIISKDGNETLAKTFIAYKKDGKIILEPCLHPDEKIKELREKEQEQNNAEAAMKENERLETEIERLKAENAALRSATQYLIDDGGADCCAKCIYCPQPTEEDDDCLCHHGGDCVDGVTKWFMQNG
ncbi:MAG TPA: hypothetical protein IAC67_03870 [Candidatus Coproplasma excrementipullorum]|nr:hypothetical protein [Candidatus Coproplasma excrementipullorum]